MITRPPDKMNNNQNLIYVTLELSKNCVVLIDAVL